MFLKNEKPILFDEWQDAPKIWGTIRKDSDDHPENTGEYFLTGHQVKKLKRLILELVELVNLQCTPCLYMRQVNLMVRFPLQR